MDPPLYARFLSYGELLHSTGGLGLLPHHPLDALLHEVPPIFSCPDRPDPWLLVQCNQRAARQHTVGGQGREPIT